MDNMITINVKFSDDDIREIAEQLKISLVHKIREIALSELGSSEEFRKMKYHIFKIAMDEVRKELMDKNNG